MLPRSLSNFMNAFTSSDHTSYPFATTNQKDFNNLMSVYLDATLHPLLTENDFIQEGWRIGPANPLENSGETVDGRQSKLVFKGVVYNEMKGQMSDAGYLYYIRFQNHIFPDMNNSGGDPQKMTNLTYKDLKDFHAQNYHPSNSKIFTYGDMPLEDHLLAVDRQLNTFQRKISDAEIKTPRDLSNGPLNFTVKGPTDPLVDKSMQYKTSTSWLMGDTANLVENFSLGVMSTILMDGYGSPLYRSLIESGLGQDWSPNSGYDNSGKIGIFSVGLNGVKREDVSKVKDVVRSTLLEVQLNGFEKGKVDGLLHQLELSLKHKTANFGMGIMQRIQPTWFNGVNPLDALAWEDTVTAFKQRFADGGYLEGLLNKYLLNDHTLTFTMEPSETYGDELANEEAARLSLKLAEMSKKAGGDIQAHEKLQAQELELLEAQESARNQDLSCLPTVHVKDIPRMMEIKPTQDSILGDTKVQWRGANTNGLTYFRAINLLEGLPLELRLLIPLFNDCLMRLGTKSKSMEELEDLIKLKTGGIGVSYFTSVSPTDINTASEGLSFSGYALDKNMPEMYELLRMILQETVFDGTEAESKIRQLLQSDASGALNAIANSGHSYARRYSESGLTPQGLLNEQTGGLTQVQHIATLVGRSSSEGLGDVITKLKTIQKFAISNSKNLRTALTCGSESISDNEKALHKFLSSLPATSTAQIVSSLAYDAHNSRTFFPLPYQVYYSALSLATVPYTHADSAPLQVLSQLLTHKHLHHEIREKGGAYGGGAYARSLSGVFGFYSYRDPNPSNTMKIMLDAGRWALDKEWSDRDLEEAKLSVFQGIDAPESVSDEGMTRFLSGVDETMEQIKREELLDVRIDNIREVTQRYLIEKTSKYHVTVLGEKKEWPEEGDGWDIKNLQMAESLDQIEEEEEPDGDKLGVSA